MISLSAHLSLNWEKSISTLLTNLPESPFTPGHLSILNNSSSRTVSVTIIHGIFVIFITESKSKRCMKINSLLYCSINCCCLNNASKSFKDTATFSFPKRFAASCANENISGLEKFNITRFTPAYKICFTSSSRFMFPPAIIGMGMTLFIF